MASHIRYLLQYGGRYYCGKDVRSILHQLNFPLQEKIQTCSDIIKVYERVKKTHKVNLWVFREKRHVIQTKSHYKKLCAKYGIGRYQIPDVVAPGVMKVKWEIGGLDGNNQPAGQARAARRAIQPPAAVHQWLADPLG